MKPQKERKDIPYIVLYSLLFIFTIHWVGQFKYIYFYNWSYLFYDVYYTISDGCEVKLLFLASLLVSLNLFCTSAEYNNLNTFKLNKFIN